MPTDAEVREQETVEQVTRTDSPRMPEFPTKDGNWFRFIRSVRSWRGRNVRVPMWEVMVTQEILPNQPELRGKAVFGGEWCDEKVYVLHKVLKIPSENVRKVSKRAKESILALEDVGIGYYDGGQDCNRKGALLWNLVVARSKAGEYPKGDLQPTGWEDWSYWLHEYYTYDIDRFNESEAAFWAEKTQETQASGGAPSDQTTQ